MVLRVRFTPPTKMKVNTMSKFSSAQVKRGSNTSPIQTTDKVVATHEGARGYKRTYESELFLLAVTNMVGEDTFYETADARDSRFVELVHRVTKGNPAFIAGGTDKHPQGLIKFLRDVAQMRSASAVMAAEYVRAGGPNGRSVVSAALQRPDEPGEILGYWMSNYGKSIPAALKRGVADVTARMLNEKQAIKYDGQSKGIRLGDVIELTHPVPRYPAQSDLFKYLLDKRHNRDNPRISEQLAQIKLDQELIALPVDKRREAFNNGLTAQAGWSWERLAGWLPGGMDAKAWEGIIPNMGYMALLRNLRNFDQAGISDDVADQVIAKLTDPKEVANSRQFPFRFLSAHKAASGSLRWGRALDKALSLSCGNIPEFSGRTLVLCDVSGSMMASISRTSTVPRYEIAALFAAATSKRQPRGSVDVVVYGTHSCKSEIPAGASVLTTIKNMASITRSGTLGYGTHQWQTLANHWDRHDRVIIFTDEQTQDNSTMSSKVPFIHVFNLGGYAPASMKSDIGRYTYGGFTDATFRLMPLLETTVGANWPF